MLSSCKTSHCFLTSADGGGERAAEAGGDEAGVRAARSTAQRPRTSWPAQEDVLELRRRIRVAVRALSSLH